MNVPSTPTKTMVKLIPHGFHRTCQFFTSAGGSFSCSQDVISDNLINSAIAPNTASASIQWTLMKVVFNHSQRTKPCSYGNQWMGFLPRFISSFRRYWTGMNRINFSATARERCSRTKVHKGTYRFDTAFAAHETCWTQTLPRFTAKRVVDYFPISKFCSDGNKQIRWGRRYAPTCLSQVFHLALHG